MSCINRRYASACSIFSQTTFAKYTVWIEIDDPVFGEHCGEGWPITPLANVYVYY